MTGTNYPLRYQKLWISLGGVLVAAIIFGSLSPLEFSSAFSTMDKVQHALAYAILTGWFLLIFHGRKASLMVVTFALFLGASMEIAQSFTDYRYAEWLDMAANFLGVLLGSVVAMTPLRFTLAKLERF